MAEERVIRIRGDLKQAEQSFKELTDTILEQKKITIELEEELLRLKRIQESIPKTQLAARQKVQASIDRVTDSLKEQRIAMKRLNLQKQEAKADISFQKRQGFISKELIKSRENTAALNMVTGGYFGQLRKGVKLLRLTRLGFISAARGVSVFSKALIASGIGAIVVAVGLLIANFDKIKKLVSGVSSETTDLLKKQTDAVAEEEKRFKAIEGSENILKQQGKTEKEILALKIAQTKAVISQLEAQLETQEQIKKSQVETAQRNKDILQGILSLLSAPLTAVLVVIDGIGKFLGKDFGLREGLFGGIAGLVFDPEKVEEEADKSIETTQNKLNTLKNTLAGFENSVTQIEDNEKAKRDANEIKREKQKASEIEAIRQALIDTDEERQAEEIRKNEEHFSKLRQQIIQHYGIMSPLLAELDEAEKKKLAEINEKYKKAEVEIEEETQEAKKSALSIFADASQAMSNMLGKQTAIGKGFAIASALMNTYEAANKTLKDETIPNTFARIAAMFTVISTGIGNVKSIMSVKVPGQGGGGGALPSAIAQGSAAPAFNIVGASPENQLAQSLAEQEQQPVQAYVVSQDVTSAQSLENNIIEGASIGD
tara:strand:+ start:4550 stop:6352 length:1803 start_codon:yes stop_codon:yes gene_type:complete